MVYEVVYTPQFEDDFVELMDYLVENWSENAAKQFGNQLDDLINTLSKMPFIGKNPFKIHLLEELQLQIKIFFIIQ